MVVRSVDRERVGGKVGDAGMDVWLHLRTEAVSLLRQVTQGGQKDLVSLSSKRCEIPEVWLAAQPVLSGTWPWRFGSAYVVLPLPPNVVPISENRARFCGMLRIWPLHSAQYLGGKPKA